MSADPDLQRLDRVLHLIRARVPIEGLQVLDLACRTGLFTAALAKAGAQAVGIEGRPENLDPANFVDGTGYVLDDVRNLAVHRNDTYDVTLCLGILYHLAAIDAITLLRAMRAVTTRFAIVDTHVALQGGELATVDGVDYDGRWFIETDGPWAAIDNEASWWFTRQALDTAILAAGWTSIEHVDGAGWDGEAADRRWLVIS